MSAKAQRNLHVPLSEPLHGRLRSVATRLGLPATTLAREAIEAWVGEREKEVIHEAIVTYASEMAGTSVDLDEGLERAGIAHLLGARQKR